MTDQLADDGLHALEAAAAIAGLAEAGPAFARAITRDALLADAARMLQDLTRSESAFGLAITDGTFDRPSGAGLPSRWPAAPNTTPPWRRLGEGEPYVGPLESLLDSPTEGTASSAMICFPVMRAGAAIAVLGATHRRGWSFRPTDVHIGVVLANYLSAGMTNTELHRTLAERERELQQQATHDPLTGLANRRAVAHRIDEVLARSATGTAGLMFLDIDNVKAVNDRLGHEVGDELIQQVAARLRGSARAGDFVARFSGDEFVVLLDGLSDLTDLTEAVERIRPSLAQPIPLRGEPIPVSASIGAVLGRRGTTASVMLRDADAAMHVAKRKGPGRIEIFDDAAAYRSLDSLDLRFELAHALERGQLSVVYQPLVHLQTKAIPSFEALVRWTHPDRGPVSPDVFIPMAEETGEIVAIGTWVLEQSCVALADWQRQFPGAGLTMGVNISAVQLEPVHPDLVAIITAAGADPNDIWLEVTERMDTSADIAEQVNALRLAGVHFALDDFGMSYSSLTYLQQFPVEGIKIDRSFIAPMTDGETQRGIVRAILALGQSLSVNVIAEGIETQEQVDALLELGCTFGQGYLLAPPMTPDECAEALHRTLTITPG